MRGEETWNRAGRRPADARAAIASAVNRLAGALFGDDETTLTPESLIAAAAKAPRLDARPLADPRLIEALAALTLSLKEEASLSPFGRLAAGWDLKRISRHFSSSRTRNKEPKISTPRLAPPISEL